MRARDMTLGSELDRVELPGPPSKGSLDSPSKVLPTAPNSNSAGDDWELASILRAGGQVTSADLGTLHKSFKPEIAPCGSSVRLRPTFVYKENTGVCPVGGGCITREPCGLPGIKPTSLMGQV